jgi:NADH-quinone oxidoreductase subunit I
MLRCIFCGYCEDACPTDAIVLTDKYELSSYDRRSQIYTKEQLIVLPPQGRPGTPQQVPAHSFDRSILPEGLVSEP